MVACLSGGMPMPVSVTAKCSVVLPVVVRRPRGPATSDVAALGELDRVADQVRQDLPQPRRVADERRRARPASMSQMQLEPLLIARASASGLSVSRDQSADENGDGLELELARLDLREVEDVVEDRQQRVGRRPHRGRGTRAARA